MKILAVMELMEIFKYFLPNAEPAPISLEPLSCITAMHCFN